MKHVAGVDIGGTKCAIAIGKAREAEIEILAKKRFPTPPTPQGTIQAIVAGLEGLFAQFEGISVDAIGISCGGPLDTQNGLILSPPNLPGWDRIDLFSPLQQFGIPVGLQNDANACALAEWKWGAGRGCHNLVFLTFGTGMGAGLIINDSLYTGANDMAGEVGHIRLENDGPIGYGKRGSFEGFCSGGGIAELARQRAEAALRSGTSPRFCPTVDDLPEITAEKVALAANQKDPLAVEIFMVVSHQLGKGLAILIDILNPECIIIGSIFTRQQALIESLMLETLRTEALSQSLSGCQIVPAALGESLGDYASLSVAHDGLTRG
jgi:glucokinase